MGFVAINIEKNLNIGGQRIPQSSHSVYNLLMLFEVICIVKKWKGVPSIFSFFPISTLAR
jgi:hypothetical protein